MLIWYQQVFKCISEYKMATVFEYKYIILESLSKYVKMMYYNTVYKPYCLYDAWTSISYISNQVEDIQKNEGQMLRQILGPKY